MVEACKQLHAECKRVDHEVYEGEVHDEIRQMIGACRAVIADLSGARPNVLYEMGYADGVGKPVVPVTGADLSELPFDVRNRNTLQYTSGQTHRLVEPLRARLRPHLE